MEELSRLSEDVTAYSRIQNRAGDAEVLWELAAAGMPHWAARSPVSWS